MRVILLNHASVLVEVRGIRLLTDPWFEGYCFREAWGLRFRNKQAFDVASTATHLWVSHLHNDHLHHPTLKRLVGLNPDLVCLGNISKNFRLDEPLRRAGFRNIVPFLERRPLELADGVQVTRFPTTGTDNMLLLRSAAGVLLNYNDCVLPPWSRRRLARRFGDIDLYLANFNHGGKVLRHPLPEPDEIRKTMKANFLAQMRSFAPRYVIPFASFHYYRAPETQEQNISLMEPEDLAELDDRVVPLKLGQTFECPAAGKGGEVLGSCAAVDAPRNPRSTIDRKESYSIEQLRLAATRYCRFLKKGFPGLVRLLPPLRIQVEDLDARVELVPHKVQLNECTDQEPAHVSASSEALFHWFNDTFGTDTFIVGGHFSMTSSRIVPMKWQSAFGFLVDHRIDLASILKMLLSVDGWRFLYNRREEIGGILLNRKIQQ
jgi:hypothetical protein